MVTIGIAKWTPKTGHEMGKRFENWKPLPDFIKVSGPYMYTAGDEGLKSITIFKQQCPVKIVLKQHKPSKNKGFQRNSCGIDFNLAKFSLSIISKGYEWKTLVFELNRTAVISKYAKEKAGEASEAISNAYMIFYGVPGYRYSLNLASGATATMKMMGLGQIYVAGLAMALPCIPYRITDTGKLR